MSEYELDHREESLPESSPQVQVQLAARVFRLPPYMFGRINYLLYEKRRAGRDVIDLGMGNPDLPTPQPIVDKMCEVIQDSRTHRYSASRGIYRSGISQCHF